ncbi:MAG TPA: substrate-binding domain-containing protein, partial [Thermoanaerobaculia bacterium]
AFAMIRHLAGLGHRRIALIQGPANNYDARERRRGYLDALAALGLAGGPLDLAGDFTEESGYRAGREIVAMAERPSAVFAANDSMAIGCLFALREGGLQVPRDISLCGFDDIPIARFTTPPLTSVRVRIAELGTKAMEHLLNAVASGNGHERRQETLGVELVVRESCRAGAETAFRR